MTTQTDTHPVVTHHPDDPDVLFIHYAGVRIQLNLFAHDAQTDAKGDTAPYVTVDVLDTTTGTPTTIRTMAWTPSTGSRDLDAPSGLDRLVGEDAHFASIFIPRHH